MGLGRSDRAFFAGGWRKPARSMGEDAGSNVPLDHPRRESLQIRHRLEAGVDAGITSRAGLIAHGRGEAFDYLLGEETTAGADRAARAAAAALLRAGHPVISVNGNAAALVPRELVDLGEVVDAVLEVNLFNRTPERVEAIIAHLRDFGAEGVLGAEPTARISGLSHARGRVEREGIYRADVVLIPLEDGDRAEALAGMGKREIVIDLNPLSRSAQVAEIPVVDNIVRAVPNIARHAEDLSGLAPEAMERVLEEFDREAVLAEAERRIRAGVSD